MALTITVNGAGTFTASMEEGPVSFSASLGAIGPKGDTGATGATGPGVAAGGTTGQILVKTTNADYATGWIDNAARSVFISGRNNTGSTIAKGAVVYLSGATGNKATIALAQANSEATSARTIGITKAEVANGADVDVVISGAIENINTSAFSAGQVVYLSASTAGGLTTTLPTQPNHGVVIGIVTRSNANNGSIEVTVQNYQELKELSDVLVSNPQNGQALIYETSSGLWKNLAIPAPDLSAYLTSATAASTYAPIVHTHTASQISDSTSAGRALLTAADAPAQRTSLGLGTMATETASDYLTKAGNLSGLASNATARTNLDVYSKSESDALVPAASTTVAGKVELATEIETRTATSSTLATTPAGVRFAIMNPARLAIGAAGWTAGSSGTGAGAGQNFNQKQVTAPTSVAGHGVLYYSYVMRAPGGAYNGTIDWSKRHEFTFLIAKGTANTTDANTVGRVVIGKPSFSSTPGDPTDDAVGIRLIGGGFLQLIVHNGTTLTAVTTTTGVTGQIYAGYRIVSDGTGNVTLWENDVQIATTSAGPTGTGGNSVTAEAQNLATITGTGMQIVVANFTADFGF